MGVQAFLNSSYVPAMLHSVISNNQGIASGCVSML